MKKIAIIGASYLQLPLIEKAKSMGIETHVFAWEANDVGEVAADFFYPISIVEKENILNKCKEIGIDGICSVASDLAVVTVNYVAMSMGLVGNTIESTKKCTNKLYMREALKKRNDPIPKFICVDENIDLSKIDFSYPLIVKPVDRSGSRGICKIEKKEDLTMAVKNAFNEGFIKNAMIEEYVDGKEYSVEYMSYKGTHYFLALTEKFTTGAPHFIETGHIEPANIKNEILDKIKVIIPHALDTLEIKNGASHSEIKINDEGKIKIIEIGGRMGGDCIGTDLVYYSTGIDFVKAVIDIAIGNEPDFKQVVKPIRVKSVFLFEKNDFDELERLKKIPISPIIKIVDYHPERIGTTTDSSNRCGCYIMKI